MNAVRFAQASPWLALAAGVLLCLGLVTYARRAGLGQRPVLAALAGLGALPLVYVLATWSRLIDERWVRLARPLWTFPVAAALFWLALRLRGLSPRQSPVRRALTEAGLGLAALLAALSAVGVSWGRPLDRLAILVAIDKSRSVDLVPDAAARVRAELAVAELGMKDDDRIGTLAFAAGAELEDPLRERARPASPQTVELGRDATDLGAAIRRALSEVPSDAAARIVIVSDGVSTRGDPLQAAAAAVAAGVPVDVVPLDQSVVSDVRVVAVRAPTRASKGEPLDLKIVTQSSQPADVELRIFADGKLQRRALAHVASGEDVVVLRDTAPGPGLHRYDVELSAQDPQLDQAAEDNQGSCFVRVRGESAALVIEGDRGGEASLVRSLEAAAFRVDWVGAAGVPRDIAELAAYDVVFLSDIPASALTPTQIEAFGSYVRDLGGGLVLMGGDRSLGPGGYGHTAIEEISPVSFDLKQERKRASLAEVIVIDYSGSMSVTVGGQTKIALANEAAARAASLLGAGDRLGVAHVDTAVSWTVPLGPVTDSAAVAKAIRAVSAGGGGIYVDLSLNEAYAALAKETVNLKHVLLFADGSDAEERTAAPSLVAAAKSRGITTSVVSLGRGSDVPALEAMSKAGDGRFYLVEDARRLPAVFAQETILAARSAINETPFVPSPASGGPATRGIDFAQAPSLGGYVVTLPKARTELLLRGPDSDPVLAVWSVGVGRSAVFTSDFKDRWGGAWTRWEGAPRLFGQLARDVARRADDPHVRLEADATGGSLHVRATAVDDDGRSESFRRLRARVGGPDGFSADVTLEAVGAGAYAATVPLARPGAYVVTAVDELRGEPLATTGAALSAGEELRPTGSDRGLLARVAELTGGKVRDTLAGVFRERETRRFAYRDLDAWLMAAAAVTLLASVGLRRIDLPDPFAAWRARRQKERLARGRADEQARHEQREQAVITSETLLRAKARAADDAPRPVRLPERAPATRAKSSDDAPPPSVPRVARETRGPTPHSPKAKSSAEILLERRRGRRP